MMDIRDLDKRLAAMRTLLVQLADGSGEPGELEAGDDALGEVEDALNTLAMDMHSMAVAAREREAFLEEQQQALDQKSEIIDAQRAQVADQERDLATKLRVIEQQANAINQLSTPIMEIWRDILLLPIVGTVDTHRSVAIKRALLRTIGTTRSKCVILDITGVELVDSSTANHLLKVVRASNLMGARCVLTGLSDCVAETLVDLGIDLAEVETLGSLRDGLRYCLTYVRNANAGLGQLG